MRVYTYYHNKTQQGMNRMYNFLNALSIRMYYIKPDICWLCYAMLLWCWCWLYFLVMVLGSGGGLAWLCLKMTKVFRHSIGIAWLSPKASNLAQMLPMPCYFDFGQYGRLMGTPYGRNPIWLPSVTNISSDLKTRCDIIIHDTPFLRLMGSASRIMMLF